MRKLFLDTETTGLHPHKGDKIVELAFVEMIGNELTGNNLHSYINPGRDIPEAVVKIHGITNEKVKDWPPISDIKQDIIDYVIGEHKYPPLLIAHNAQFDMSFLRAELNLFHKIKVLCTKKMAQKMDKVGAFERGYKLDDLMKRFKITTARELHGALLDATILADVYLAMTKDFYI
jgi:DNA polymerase III epsilon subunit